MPPPYDWKPVWDTLAELYLVERLPLKQVMEIMQNRHGFTPRLDKIYTVKIISIQANSLQSSGIQRWICTMGIYQVASIFTKRYATSCQGQRAVGAKLDFGKYSLLFISSWMESLSYSTTKFMP